MTDIDNFSATPTMTLLRDFQRRTVDHVFKRFYAAENPAMRFLVADEVGLGKTMVARGVIARSIEYLRDRVKRIDVIYICSNAAIARQNITRINPVKTAEVSMATRLTLLPLELAAHPLGDSKLNLISFTPDTSLNLASRGGTAEERALLYWILEEGGFGGAGLRNLLQCSAGKESWDNRLHWRREYDPALAADFVRRVKDDSALVEELKWQCKQFGYWREHWPSEHHEGRYRLIGRLRHKLAITCLGALKPDLIIMDEFQRFKDLLTGESEAAQLARGLFDYADQSNNHARTLLLSATPYRMPLQDTDQTGGHYEDFFATISFLCNNNTEQLETIRLAFDRYRSALYTLEPTATDQLLAARDDVRSLLLRFMVRTERVGDTNALDAMVREIHCPVTVEIDDIRQGVLLDKLAAELKARGAIDYWKSAAYPLAFMSQYDLTEKMQTAMARPSSSLHSLLLEWRNTQRTKAQMRNYVPVPLTNGRLRALAERTVQTGLAHTLWLPPSLPYYKLEGAWLDLKGSTKTLVFSQWDLAPNGIAALLSYDAERRIREAAVPRTGRLSYREFGRRRGGLRIFRLEADKPIEMAQFTILYPCMTLAAAIDPLALGAETLEQAKARVIDIVKQLAEERVLNASSSREGDNSWHWALLARLDRADGAVPPDWLDRKDSWLATEEAEGAELSGAAEVHLRHFAAAGSIEQPLGALPIDYAEVLAEQALGSPAICALRALGRIARDTPLTDPRLARAAGHVAQAFRSLFNRPEAALLLAAREDAGLPYWRQVLRYCAEGNLQAVLDEYAHLLVENLGLFDSTDSERFSKISEEMAAALTLRAARVDMHQIKAREGGFFDDPHAVRCRFAMRLSESRDETGGQTRLEQVRQAFNSPFWPFVLASTSVGQEGLDFHPYCHSVWHWNLPTNPVDMEQREGRVHRFKGHAVRCNIAEHFGREVLGKGSRDPWSRMFDRARTANSDRSELIPYWVFEVPDGASVERHVPILPFSRETDRYRALQRTIALYRLAFGQPRHEDLINWLQERFKGPIPADTADWRIDLAPPQN